MSFTSIAAVGAVPSGSYYDRSDVVRYTTFAAALGGEPDGALIVLMPGTHNHEPLTINRVLTIIGIADTPDETILQAADVNGLVFGQSARVTLENLRINALSATSWNSLIILPSGATTTTLTANRCVFWGGNNNYNVGFSSTPNSTGTPNRLRFQNCTLLRGGYSHFLRQSLAGISFRRCYMPNRVLAECTGTLYTDDTVSTPTIGYGADYGWLNQDQPTVSQRAWDLQDFQPVTATLFDWDAPQQFFTRADTDSEHRWSSAVRRGMRYGIYYLGSDPRCPPIIHGPYTAE